MTTDGELWHFVEAKRDDGMPTMFNIRELEPKRQLTKIFVVELPYPKSAPACLPSAADFRRQASFDEQWLRPACGSLGWELVGSKIEDGSFFFYMYGDGDPNTMIERLSPFDGSLGFYDDDDPDWQEYGTLRDLLARAKEIPKALRDSIPALTPVPTLVPAASTQPMTKRARATTVIATPRRNGKPKPAKASKAKATATAKAKPKAKLAKKSRALPKTRAKAKLEVKAKRTSAKRATR